MHVGIDIVMGNGFGSAPRFRKWVAAGENTIRFPPAKRIGQKAPFLCSTCLIKCLKAQLDSQTKIKIWIITIPFIVFFYSYSYLIALIIIVRFDDEEFVFISAT